MYLELHMQVQNVCHSKDIEILITYTCIHLQINMDVIKCSNFSFINLTSCTLRIYVINSHG